jgi:hypothetical protein
MSGDAKDRNVPNRELLGLLWDLCEENLTAEQAARLNELLLANPECRRTLVEFMHMAAELEWEHSGHALGSANIRLPNVELSNIATPNSAAIAGIRRDDKDRAIPRPNRPMFSETIRPSNPSTLRALERAANWLQLGRIVSMSRAAAVLLLIGTLCLGALAAVVVTTSVMRAPVVAAPTTPAPFVAKLTATHQVKWADEATAPMVDQLLTEGQVVETLAGWAEISFKSGARLVVEGPAKLQIEKVNSARLIQGKVATDETARKAGFTLDTPAGRVIDLGAEFGVAVDANRTMEVDVFAGTAEVRLVSNGAAGGAGPVERVTANQFVRAVDSEGQAGSVPTLQRLSTSANHFVRTMRSKTFVLGSQCIGRSERDLAKGTVCFLSDPTPNSGRAASFSFFNVHADVDRWITPIILAFDRSTGAYRVTGIGQSVLNLGSGLQTVRFELIAGSADLEAGVHTFGFYHGTIDKTGKATSASLGPLDYANVPEPMDPASPIAAEARWLFVPGDASPVALRLDLEFNMAPKAGQVPLWPGKPGDPKFTRERVYSGRLEIIVEPGYPQTATGDFVAKATVGAIRSHWE